MTRRSSEDERQEGRVGGRMRTRGEDQTENSKKIESERPSITG